MRKVIWLIIRCGGIGRRRSHSRCRQRGIHAHTHTHPERRLRRCWGRQIRPKRLCGRRRRRGYIKSPERRIIRLSRRNRSPRRSRLHRHIKPSHRRRRPPHRPRPRPRSPSGITRRSTLKIIKLIVLGTRRWFLAIIRPCAGNVIVKTEQIDFLFLRWRGGVFFLVGRGRGVFARGGCADRTCAGAAIVVFVVFVVLA